MLLVSWFAKQGFLERAPLRNVGRYEYVYNSVRRFEARRFLSCKIRFEKCRDYLVPFNVVCYLFILLNFLIFVSPCCLPS